MQDLSIRLESRRASKLPEIPGVLVRWKNDPKTLGRLGLRHTPELRVMYRNRDLPELRGVQQLWPENRYLADVPVDELELVPHAQALEILNDWECIAL